MDIVPKSGTLRIIIKVKKVCLIKLKIYLNRGIIMYRMVIVYKHEEPEEEVLFKDKETAEYFRDYFYKDDNIAYVRIDEIEEE